MVSITINYIIVHICVYIYIIHLFYLMNIYSVPQVGILPVGGSGICEDPA